MFKLYKKFFSITIEISKEYKRAKITLFKSVINKRYFSTYRGMKITPLPLKIFIEPKSVGAIFTVNEIAKRLGITTALGKDRNAMLALFQIAGRIISQGSRNYLAKEWKNIQDINEVFKLDNFNEDSLYRNLDWLADNQEKSEKKHLNLV